MGAYSIAIGDVELAGHITVFKERKQSVSHQYETPNLILSKFTKIGQSTDSCFFENDNFIVYAWGTFSYHRLNKIESFQSLVNDLIADSLDEVFGHFTIIAFHKHKKRLDIYFDEAGYGGPYVIDGKYISNSFLACCQFSKKLTINHEAVFEEVYTGCYFNQDTTFCEIERITGYSERNFNDSFVIRFIPISISITASTYKDRKSAINDQVHVLRSYLSSWSPQIDDFRGDLGLSSGYDSRLLLSLLSELGSSLQVHSYWKKIEDFDTKIAHLLAKEINQELIQVPVKDSNDEEIESRLKKALLFYDGLFPANHGWVREYRTIEYRLKILGNSRFGLSGLSGEQYRNEYHLLNKRYRIDWVIKNMMLDANNFAILSKSPFMLQGMSRLRGALSKGLALEDDRNGISRENIQKFYCNMWVKGGAGIRNQIENQISSFLSPFTDRYLQKHALKAIPYLGLSGRFQADMITLINPKLAAINSDYGYSFDNIPRKYDLLAALGTILDKSKKKKILRYFKSKPVHYLERFGKNKSRMVQKIDNLKDYNFPFLTSSEDFQQDTIDRLIALSTILDAYQDKIEC